VTPSEIEPATFRFVAQCLSHYATAIEINKRYKIMENMDDEDDTDNTIDEK
jgi:hypothetical protein